MPIYSPHEATLGDLEGQGFAFSKKTSLGKSYQGVFFADDEDALNALKEEERVEYAGILYDRSRELEETFPVSITNVILTRSGMRADFVRVEEEED